MIFLAWSAACICDSTIFELWLAFGWKHTSLFRFWFSINKTRKVHEENIPLFVVTSLSLVPFRYKRLILNRA